MVIICNSVLGAWNLPLYAQDTSKEEEALFVAQKAFEDGFYDVSLGLLERFLKSYPASEKAGEVNLLMGQCYFYQNRFLEALGRFEEVLKLPKARNLQDAAFYWIAEVHFRGNDFEKAASFYKKVADNFPKSAYLLPSLYSLGWCNFAAHNWGTAITYFTLVEERYPAEPQAQDASFKIIECLYNLKEYAKVKESVQEYLKLYPKDAVRSAYLYFYAAEASYYLGNFKGAIEEYSKSISSTGDVNLRNLSLLGSGWSYLKSKQYQNAEDVFSKVNKEAIESKAQESLLLGKAMLNYETGKFSEARKLYEQLGKDYPDSPVLTQYELGKADALYNLGEYEAAIGAYKAAMEKVTSATAQEVVDNLHYGLAWTYLKQAEFKLAIDEFQKIAKQSDDKVIKVAALCQIGDAYQESGDFAKAQAAYDKILKDYPDSLYNDYIQYQLGLTLLKTANYDGAIMSFQSLRQNFPTSRLLDDATYALGLSYFQREDYNSSREIFEKFQDEFKDSNLRSQALYLLGTSLYNLGDYAKAIEAFKNIVRLYGQETDLVQKAEYEIADCFYQMGNEAEAIARFKALRSKYPDSSLTAEIMWWLGEYYYRKNDLDLARRYFSSLIRDFPKSELVTSCYYALGSTYAQEGKFPEALENFKVVVTSARSDLAGQAAVAMSDIYLRENKVDLALSICVQAKEKYPNLASLIYPKIADIHSRMGNYDDALAFYRESLDIVPVRSMSDIQFKIAETLQAEGRHKDAIEEYLKVTYLYSENSALTVKALLRVASIYEDQDNFKEALNIYKKVSLTNSEEAKYARERMDWIRTNIR